MEKYNFWLTIATAVLPAAISAIISFLASRYKNRSDIESLEKKFNHEMTTIEKNHFRELEKMKEAHTLELENIQKQSEAEVNNTVAQGLMTMLGSAMTPALSKYLEENDVFNQPPK
ncbi:TPA: hypothetical protein VCF60_000258 [Streptococcus pyogenes]|nr:hypothetical protein [Streptococcus pyogenes]